MTLSSKNTDGEESFQGRDIFASYLGLGYRIGTMTRTAFAAGFVAVALAQASWSWTPQQSGTTERFRGVSAVSEKVAWASGNRGSVVRTIDGGATWTVRPVPGAEALDFRDIEAFDASTAYVLSIGPGDKSRIYKTTDGGRVWTLQFTNADPKAFYDAIAFWDAKTGLAFGDPVDGKFTVIRTIDGGQTWTRTSPAALPDALPDEGAFAASGTCLVVGSPKNAWFGTGGAARARVFRTTDMGLTWSVADTPIAAGNASSGIFSLAFSDAQHGLAIGGDYRKERESGDNLARTSDGGRTWNFIGSTRLREFRSAIAFVPETKDQGVFAVGPGGADYSRDGGASWTPTANGGFHALSIAAGPYAGWGVGEKGSIGRLAGSPTSVTAGADAPRETSVRHQSRRRGPAARMVAQIDRPHQ
jgi:photosystem II stability/assembly factor-like uncharacterized protein